MKMRFRLESLLKFLIAHGDEVEKQYEELFKTGEYYSLQREKILALNVKWIGRNKYE